MDDISLFLGFFSVIFAVFSCEMGVKIFYMPLFKPKKGGLELGRGTSKSNRICRNTDIAASRPRYLSAGTPILLHTDPGISL